VKTLKYLFLFLTFNSLAQDFELVTTIKFNADEIVSDPLNYIYISKRDHIKKLNENGDTLYQQSLKLSGSISTIDAGQALRTLIYHEDQQLIGFLDNTLSWHNEPRDLTKAGIRSSTAACHSFLGNSFWIFDQENFSLKRFDHNLKKITESGNLSAIFNHSFQVYRMKEVENKLYVQIEDQEIYVFDVFGTFIKKIPVKTNEKFEIINNNIYFISEGELHKYNTLDFEKQTLKLPHETIKNFTITDKRLVIQEEGTIYFYRLK